MFEHQAILDANGNPVSRRRTTPPPSPTTTCPSANAQFSGEFSQKRAGSAHQVFTSLVGLFLQHGANACSHLAWNAHAKHRLGTVVRQVWSGAIDPTGPPRSRGGVHMSYLISNPMNHPG